MASTDELLDALMNNCKRPGDLLGDYGLLQHLLRNSTDRTMPSGRLEDRTAVTRGKRGREQ